MQISLFLCSGYLQLGACYIVLVRTYQSPLQTHTYFINFDMLVLGPFRTGSVLIGQIKKSSFPGLPQFLLLGLCSLCIIVNTNQGLKSEKAWE